MSLATVTPFQTIQSWHDILLGNFILTHEFIWMYTQCFPRSCLTRWKRASPGSRYGASSCAVYGNTPAPWIKEGKARIAELVGLTMQYPKDYYPKAIKSGRGCIIRHPVWP